MDKNFAAFISNDFAQLIAHGNLLGGHPRETVRFCPDAHGVPQPLHKSYRCRANSFWIYQVLVGEFTLPDMPFALKVLSFDPVSCVIEYAITSIGHDYIVKAFRPILKLH